MRKIALVLVALVVALGAGCSDDSDSDSGGGGNDDGGGEAAGSAFCEGLQSFADIGSESLTGEEGAAAIEELTALDPPAEIADDYATFVGYLESLAAGETPDEATTDAWNEATARVDSFAAEECGLTAG